jgi:hypothetical protein
MEARSSLGLLTPVFYDGLISAAHQPTFMLLQIQLPPPLPPPANWLAGCPVLDPYFYGSFFKTRF